MEVSGEERVVEIQDGVLVADTRQRSGAADHGSFVARELRREEVGDERDEKQRHDYLPNGSQPPRNSSIDPLSPRVRMVVPGPVGDGVQSHSARYTSALSGLDVVQPNLGRPDDAAEHGAAALVGGDAEDAGVVELFQFCTDLRAPMLQTSREAQM